MADEAITAIAVIGILLGLAILAFGSLLIYSIVSGKSLSDIFKKTVTDTSASSTISGTSSGTSSGNSTVGPSPISPIPNPIPPECRGQNPTVNYCNGNTTSWLPITPASSTRKQFSGIPDSPYPIVEVCPTAGPCDQPGQLCIDPIDSCEGRTCKGVAQVYTCDTKSTWQTNSNDPKCKWSSDPSCNPIPDCVIGKVVDGKKTVACWQPLPTNIPAIDRNVWNDYQSYINNKTLY